MRSIASHIASIFIASVLMLVPAKPQSVHRIFGWPPTSFPSDTTINLHHKDVIGSWFTAPATGIIDSIFWMCGDTIGAGDSTAFLRWHASRISVAYGPGINYPPPPVAWGYFINTNELDGGIAAFPEDAPPGASWTSTIGGGQTTQGLSLNGIWCCNGFPMEIHPGLNHAAVVDGVSVFGVTQGQAFFLSLKIKGEHADDLPTQFRASHTNVPFPAHDWIFFEHDSVLNPTAPKGWWAVGGVNFNFWYSMTYYAQSFTLPLHGRWNLVSIPVELESDSAKTILPTATSSAFRYVAGKYEYGSTLKHGTGYWLTFPPSGNIGFNGIPITDDTIHVATGWNLIGTIGLTIAPSWIRSVPPGIVTSNFWGYDGAYFVAGTLTPGNGYWVKANQSGKLILSSSGSAASPLGKIAIVAGNDLPPPPPDGEIPNPKSQIPNHFGLEQNYPNPFNPLTDIRYQIADRSHVILQIFNLLGEEVARLVDEVQDAGYKSVSWVATDAPSGIYTCRLRAGAYIEVRKMLLVR